MGNRFPKNSANSDILENKSASASKKQPCKEKEIIYTKMTSRLAIRGLNWSYTSVSEVFQVFASMLQDPSELLSITLHRLKTSKTPKPDFFGVADFRSVEAAKTAFEKINAVELSERGGAFILEVIPDSVIFGDPIDECSKSNLEQSGLGEQHKMAENSPL